MSNVQSVPENLEVAEHERGAIVGKLRRYGFNEWNKISYMNTLNKTTINNISYVGIAKYQ